MRNRHPENRAAIQFDQRGPAGCSRSFQAGTLTASGQRQLWLVRDRFPTLEWADLTMDDSVTGEMVIRHREGHAAAWHDVRVHREEVLRAFPIQPGQSSGKDTFSEPPFLPDLPPKRRCY